MARVSLHSLLQGAFEQVNSPLALNRPYLSWAVGATVLVRDRGTLTTVPVYQAETGATTITNPVTIDDETVEGWVDHGQRLRLAVTRGAATVNFDVDSISGVANRLVIGTTAPTLSDLNEGDTDLLMDPTVPLSMNDIVVGKTSA